MQENKNLVKEALIQMKNVEEAIAENAKGILASTMKEEINQLVKESLSEQDEDEVEMDVDMDDEDMDTDNEDDVEMDMDMDTDDEDVEMDMDMDMDSEETPIDLTGASDEEILKVFKAMSEEDGIIVKKDGEDIHLTDNDTDSEYLVKLGESKMEGLEEEEDEFDAEDSYDDSESSEDVDSIIDDIFSEQDIVDNEGGLNLGDTDDAGMMDDAGDSDVVYEISFDDDTNSEFDEQMDPDKVEEEVDPNDYMEEGSEYEALDEEDGDISGEFDYSDYIEEQGSDEFMGEAYNPKKAKKSMKPKGVGIGNGPKFSYKTSGKGGFKEDKKEGPKTMGTGKAKFEYKKGENMSGKAKVIKKAETKEAARTLGMGSEFREGGLPKPRAHSNANTAIKKESLEAEVSMLREKNEEYRKALNVFRDKLNEVAIFNSNLAYATRLFTEHSTTKKEKINILRRFDSVESLKESKNLYKSIKNELDKVEAKPMNESVETKLNKTVSTGSSTTLIESKTYENPQFLRMKDLMSKIG